MEPPLLIWTIVFAVGAIQGVFLGFVLLYLGGSEQTTTRILAALVGCMAFLMAEECIEAARLIEALPHARESTMTLPLLIGPLFFWYAQFITKQKRKMRSADALHLLPFLLATVYFAPYYLQRGSQKISGDIQGLLAWDFEVEMLTLIKGIHLFAYIFLTLLLLHRYVRQKREEGKPARDYLNAIWSKRLIHVVLVGALGIYGLISLSWLGVEGVMESDAFGSLFMAGLTYLFAFVGIKYPALFTGVEQFKSIQQALVETTDTTSQRKYRRSGLTADEKTAHMDALLVYMETEKPYLDSQIALSDVARAVSLPSHTVSQVINELLEVNFQAFVNAYRVDEAKQRMADPEQAHKTILALAFESGFNSKTSFNRVFKQYTGMTPTQYRRTMHTDVGSDR